ncbi:MAG: ROK family protein [Erysipelothrix sp.]
MKRYLGIDIGGTNIKYGLFDDRSEKLQSKSIEVFSTPRRNLDELLENIHTVIKSELPLEGIGICLPGIMDESGVILDGGSIPCLKGVNLKEILTREYSLPVKIENDAHACAIAEKILGAGQDVENFFILTIGTGLGGAIVINQELYKGNRSIAGEVSYLNVKGEYWSRTASMSTLIHQTSLAKKMSRKLIDGYKVMEWSQSDNNIKNIYNEWLNALCEGIYNICVMLDPDVVFIGGGISENEQFIIDLQNRFKNYHSFSHNWNIQRSTFGNKSGYTGAVISLFLELGIFQAIS